MASTVNYYRESILTRTQWRYDAFTGWKWAEQAPIQTDTTYRMYKQVSYAPYAKRVRPLIPILSPTSQRKLGWVCNTGSFNYKTNVYKQQNREGNAYYVVDNCRWKNNLYPALALDYCTTKFPLYQSGSEFYISQNPEAVQEAQTKLLEKLKDQVFNMAVTTAEAAKTTKWLSQRSTGMFHMIRGIKKGDWASVRKGWRMGADDARVLDIKNGRLSVVKRIVSDSTRRKNLSAKQPAGWSTKDVSDRYLELHYAISPLISELAGAMILLSKYIDEQGMPKWHFAKGTVKRYKTADDSLVPWFWPPVNVGYPGPSPVCNVTFESTVWYSVTCLFLLKDEWAKTVSNAGVSSVGVVQAGYEIIPWSFLLDWGVGIGDYLNALDAGAGTTFLTGWDVKFLKGQMTTEGIDRKKGLAVYSENDQPFGKLRAVERSVRTSWPLPYVIVKSPFSFSHVTTAAALWRSLKSS